jgi:hypothetical protein
MNKCVSCIPLDNVCQVTKKIFEDLLLMRFFGYRGSKNIVYVYVQLQQTLLSFANLLKGLVCEVLF